MFLLDEKSYRRRPRRPPFLRVESVGTGVTSSVGKMKSLGARGWGGLGKGGACSKERRMQKAWVNDELVGEERR